MSKAIADFVRACQKIGKDPLLVQAGGGNISLKLNQNEMLIKASGLDLAQISPKRGFVTLNQQQIKEYIVKLQHADFSTELEQEYNQELSKAITEKTLAKPSLEAGFHAFLNKAIIHTHPLLVNAILCSTESKKILQEQFQDYTYVPYQTPGVTLSKAVYDAIQKSKKQSLIFLENHGLIITSETLEEGIKKTEEVRKKIKTHLQEKGVKIPAYETIQPDQYRERTYQSRLVAQWMKHKEKEQINKGFLTPDSVVYCSCGFALQKEDHKKITLLEDGTIILPEKSIIPRKKMRETITAIIFMFLVINQFAQPTFLAKQDMKNIQAMESEKYRQKVTQKEEKE